MSGLVGRRLPVTVRRPSRVITIGLFILGLAGTVLYRQAALIPYLRVNIPAFGAIFSALFVLYVAAIVLVVRNEAPQALPSAASSENDLDADDRGRTRTIVLIILFTLLFRALLLPTRPSLSDDMYRYIWDGRVQTAGLSPYAYAPAAAEVASLHARDSTIWWRINRKPAVTIYPPAAQLAFFLIYSIYPDSVTWTKAAMVLGELAALFVLLRWLRVLGLSPLRAIVLAWSPLAVFEIAGNGHLDGLVLVPLIAAFLARERQQPVGVGFWLGIATLLKLYPAIFLPALWMRRDWKSPLVFAVTVALGYLPYLGRGGSVLGFLPNYLGERFNGGPAVWLAVLARGVLHLKQPPFQTLQVVQMGLLVLLGAWFVLRPADDSARARRRVWLMIAVLTLLSQNLFSWYLIWTLPLIAVDLRPGRLGLRLDEASGWLLFSGLVMLSYTYFLTSVTVTWAIWLQYAPLVLFLLIPPWVARRRSARQRHAAASRPVM